MRVRSLVWEDPVCCGVAGSLRHSCWAWVLEPASCNYWAQSTGAIKASVPGACAPQQGRPQGWEPPALRRRVVPLSPQLEKTRAQQWRHGAVRNKIEKKKKKELSLSVLETCLMKPSFLHSKRKFHSPWLHSHLWDFSFSSFRGNCLSSNQPTPCWHLFFILVSQISAGPGLTGGPTPTPWAHRSPPLSLLSPLLLNPVGFLNPQYWVTRLCQGGLLWE